MTKQRTIDPKAPRFLGGRFVDGGKPAVCWSCESPIMSNQSHMDVAILNAEEVGEVTRAPMCGHCVCLHGMRTRTKGISWWRTVAPKRGEYVTPTGALKRSEEFIFRVHKGEVYGWDDHRLLAEYSPVIVTPTGKPGQYIVETTTMDDDIFEEEERLREVEMQKDERVAALTAEIDKLKTEAAAQAAKPAEVDVSALTETKAALDAAKKAEKAAQRKLKALRKKLAETAETLAVAQLAVKADALTGRDTAKSTERFVAALGKLRSLAKEA